MKTKKEAASIAEALKKFYPDAECSLDFGGDPWRLLVMARLSAQCTDARVNIVSRELFAELPDAKSAAEAPVERIEELIKSCGLYKTKAKSIKETAIMIERDFGGKVPDNIDDLLTLPGVGRKIANLIMGDLFGKPAIVADTHCIRLAGRMGFYPEGEKNPLVTERVLSAVIEPEEQSDFCHRMVMLGREYCTARSPRCAECPIAPFCRHGKKTAKSIKESADNK